MSRAYALRGLSAVVAVVLLGVGAFAGDSPRSPLDDAKIRARSGALVEAAARFGDAVAEAQRAGDLLAEDAAANAFALFVEREWTAAALPNDDGSELRPEILRASLLAAAMARLEPARCGAFVSAPVLARYVLQSATETGDFRHVAAAEKVASLHAARSGSGKGAAAAAKYAAGLRCVAENRSADAAAPLRAAFEEALASEWFDLAMHAGTELAFASWSAGQEDEAKRMLRAVGTMLEPPRPPRFLLQWLRVVKTRLPSADHPLRKVLDGYRAVAERYSGAGGGYGGSEGGAGRAVGGRGGAAGPEFDNRSEIGELMTRLPGTGRIVSVTRTAAGFAIQWATESRPEPVRRIDERVLPAGSGGVMLVFQSTAVAFRRLDAEGTAGAPGSTMDPQEPDPARAFYLLACDEVWSVRRDGVVTIRDR